MDVIVSEIIAYDGQDKTDTCTPGRVDMIASKIVGKCDKKEYSTQYHQCIAGNVVGAAGVGGCIHEGYSLCCWSGVMEGVRVSLI